jgi:thiosulfate/3-mercaptopyruvate sulfurtransferase
MSIDGFADRRYLIDVKELQDRIADVTLLDVRPAEHFALGTIEGSKHLDVYGVSLNDTSEQPLHAFLAIFQTLFGARGVRNERPVVVFDHESGERAARVVWLLAVLGHPDARLLDGGSHAWTRAGGKLHRLTQAPTYPDPAVAPPTAPPYKSALNLDLLANRFDVQRAINDRRTVIVDVRRDSEYRGVEKRAKRGGTIPGAVHVFWRDHLDQDGAFRPARDIRELYATKGVTPDKAVIAVCHGGYRSASTLLALKSLGYTDVRNYVGSWAEWGNRDDCPVVTPDWP